MSLDSIVTLSRRYGADPEYVIAGGGNTSFKDADTLYIKGSGTSLADIQAEGFVKMDRKRLSAIWGKQYPADPEERERHVLADLMAARQKGEEHKRPSVETLLHDMLPTAYVVHTHPSVVNGITCSRQGSQAALRLFGPQVLWIPATNPGYILSRVVKDALERHKQTYGVEGRIIFLQNHGVFVGADTVEGIDQTYKMIMDTIGKEIRRRPDITEVQDRYADSEKVAEELRRLAQESFSTPAVRFYRDREIGTLTASRGAFAPVSSAFSPDHIVYAGSDPLFVENRAGEDRTQAIRIAWADAVKKTGRAPKIVALQGLGIFGLGNNEKAARLAVELFVDAAKVACYTESFGGPQFMPPDQIDFINNWEVERYRTQVSAGNGKT
jgi:rhamnose utilization protein RhaD (predicted bifunctional aldolase and dehydrogenase)